MCRPVPSRQPHLGRGVHAPVRGLDAGRTYHVVYRATDGRDVPAGSFVAVEGEQLCRMTAALLRPQTRAIEVLDEDGAMVLRSRLS